MIDDSETGNVLIDNTGLTKTTSGGQVTIGIGAGSVDLDRIKDDDKITYAEQNAGSPAPADTNIFTASAAARRFDTLVSTSSPSGSNWETGKTWLQMMATELCLFGLDLNGLVSLLVVSLTPNQSCLCRC